MSSEESVLSPWPSLGPERDHQYHRLSHTAAVAVKLALADFPSSPPDKVRSFLRIATFNALTKALSGKSSTKHVHRVGISAQVQLIQDAAVEWGLKALADEFEKETFYAVFRRGIDAALNRLAEA